MQDYVNIEEGERISQWESPQALAILQRDIEHVDPNKVKLVSAHVNLMNLSFKFVSLKTFFFMSSSFCRLWRRVTTAYTASTSYMTA